MEVEIFSLCKSATFQNDDTVDVRGVYSGLQLDPPSYDMELLTLAIRMRFDEEERGKHHLQINVFDPRGKRVGLVVRREFEVEANEWPHYDSSVLDVRDVRFDESGTFRLTLQVNGLSYSTRFLHVERLES
jgi:hypothetical protein